MNKSKNIKAWDKKKTTSVYNVGKFSQNKRILIVCEGQTEKFYFKSFDVVSLTIECIDSKGRTKRQLVEFCEKFCEKKNNEYANNGRHFDEIWCVFDMDVNRKEKEFSDFDNAISSAQSKGFKIAYSNDAFELWFYLHYHYTDHQYLRGFYYQQLSKFWNINYEEDGKKEDYCKKIYHKLSNDKNANQQNAIKNAQKSHKMMNDLPYSQQNPVTTVYLLVNELNQFLRGLKRS
jgi:hypothetical protein